MSIRPHPRRVYVDDACNVEVKVMLSIGLDDVLTFKLSVSACRPSSEEQSYVSGQDAMRCAKAL